MLNLEEMPRGDDTGREQFLKFWSESFHRGEEEEVTSLDILGTSIMVTAILVWQFRSVKALNGNWEVNNGGMGNNCYGSR